MKIENLSVMAMKKYPILSGFLIIIILSMGLVCGENIKYINSLPYTITESGYYVLNTSCNDLNTTAIIVNANNVVLDGNGNILDGNWHNTGVLINASDVVIKHLTIKQFWTGIDIGDEYYPKTISNIKIINNNLGNYWKDVALCLGDEKCNLIYSTIVIENNIGSGNRPIYYIANKKDTTINLSGKKVPSQIIFANITNCTIKNVICKDGSGIDLVSVSYSTLDKITSSNNFRGLIISKYSHDNIIKNSRFSDNLYNGINAWLGDNLLITNCTFKNNGEYGIYLGRGRYIIYLNNFINNGVGAIASTSDTKMTLHSPKRITYIYNGKTFTNYLGNYYSDFDGVDNNGDGIGDTPYGNIDFYPLVMPYDRYITTQDYINYLNSLLLDNNEGIPNIPNNDLNETISADGKTSKITNSSALNAKKSLYSNIIPPAIINKTGIVAPKALDKYGGNITKLMSSAVHIQKNVMTDMPKYDVGQGLGMFLISIGGVIKGILHIILSIYKILKGIFTLIFDNGLEIPEYVNSSNTTATYNDPNSITRRICECLNDMG